MKTNNKAIFFCAALVSAVMAPSTAMAAGEKDCLIKGTVERSGTQDSNTQVKINSITRYSEDSRCRMRRGQKLEFKLPQDNRVEAAPTGSEVEYRYRSNKQGDTQAELVRIEA